MSRLPVLPAPRSGHTCPSHAAARPRPSPASGHAELRRGFQQRLKPCSVQEEAQASPARGPRGVVLLRTPSPTSGLVPRDSKQQAGPAAPPEQQTQGFGRKASSQNVISQQEECLKELEELKFEIQKCQFERDELYQILDLYIYDEWDHRLHVELPVLQSEHEMRMMAMQMMTNSISDAMERYKELIQVNSSYRIRHSQLLREQAQLKNNIQILLNEKRELLVEQTELPAFSVETKRLCEEARMNIGDPSATQQQV
ncbi:uncharacterized protein LOC134480460 [Rattus norvegicus]|uniref:uncharacterized protein LOC134480460 n=1 Tax=Rattus norvegicus TaxID=10116 RepID=UPI002FD8798E